MPLNGTAFQRFAQRAIVYAEGEAPLELVPQTRSAAGVYSAAVGATPIPFAHDERALAFEAVDGGRTSGEVLAIVTRTQLSTSTIYGFGGLVWTVESEAPVVAGGVVASYRYALTRHAKG